MRDDFCKFFNYLKILIVLIVKVDILCFFLFGYLFYLRGILFIVYLVILFCKREIFVNFYLVILFCEIDF